MATQQDVKTVLGKYYDEDTNYKIRVITDESGILCTIYLLEEPDEEYGEGGARLTSRLEIDADIFFYESYPKSNIYRQPLDKIKKLSMYKELVDDYGFDDDEYLDGNTEELENYYLNVMSKNEQYFNVMLQEDMQLDENALKDLEEDGETRIYTFDAKILKIESKNLPLIIEELGLLDDVLTQAKAEYEDLFKIRIADERLAFHDVTIEKDQ